MLARKSTGPSDGGWTIAYAVARAEPYFKREVSRVLALTASMHAQGAESREPDPKQLDPGINLHCSGMQWP